MTSNQKMLLLAIAAAAMFLFVPLGWWIVAALVVLLILFRDPLWDLAHATARTLFPGKQKPPGAP